MIKNWHKWFICIFSVVFVSIYFVFDAMFLANNNVELPPPIIAEEEEPPPPNNNGDNGDAEPDEPNNEPTTPIPIYTNGYVCLEDALNRFYQSTNYTWKYASAANSLGIVQNIKGVKQISENGYHGQTFAYCESSLGQKFYEQVDSSDMQLFDYILTTDINSNMEYNIDGITPQKYSLEKVLDVGKVNLRVTLLAPTKGVDKLAKFDRDSNKKYYIASFVLNVNYLSEDYISQIKNGAGASSISYKSMKVTYYISKSTGYIEKYEQEELYSMKVGINLDVSYKLVGQLQYN